jgi:DNA-binding MarR family transcriptional regulator
VLTNAGRDTLRDATQASDEAERRFLAPLSESAAKQLKGSLRKVIQKDP